MGKTFVEIGINAPDNYSIFRQEVFKEIKKKNIEAIRSVDIGDINVLKDVFKKKNKQE